MYYMRLHYSCSFSVLLTKLGNLKAALQLTLKLHRTRASSARHLAPMGVSTWHLAAMGVSHMYTFI